MSSSAADPAADARLGTSLRCRPARETLWAAQRLMPALGISRVTDITRMDRLGLPVCASIRPRGRTLRVHAGKGLDLDEARAGALMEAVEYAVAEQASAAAADAHISVGEFVAQFGGALRLVDFAPALGQPVTADRRIAAVTCEDLCSGQDRLVPAELVHMPWPADDGPPLFGWSTNGLASGNTLAEATLHALYEVLERDALAMNRAGDNSIAIDNNSLPGSVRAWAAAWQAQGIALAVRQMPNDFDLPCFEAHLHEPASTDVNLAGGSGLHAQAPIALARAVCEAAQSRLSFIHGGRDDITGFFAHAAQAARTGAAATAGEQQLIASLMDSRGAINFNAATPLPLPPTLAALLERLAARGFGTVLRRQLDLPDGALRRAGLHVVKVVVPRCETVLGNPMRMGPRLLARVLARG